MINLSIFHATLCILGSRVVATRSSIVCRPEVAPLDVRERDTGARIFGENHRRVAGADMSAIVIIQERFDSRSLPLSNVARSSIAGIQPCHVATWVVPDRHGEYHTALDRLAHLRKTASGLESGGSGVAVRVL